MTPRPLVVGCNSRPGAPVSKRGFTMSRRGHGQVCFYCRRPLESTSSTTGLGATKDHFIPRHKGGRKTVWCCRFCNELKGGKSYQTWLLFMIDYPRWWETFSKRRVNRQIPGSPKFLPVEATKRILREGKKAKRDFEKLRAMEWPWLVETISPLIHSVGFGPWH